ncbi:hypothetical protein CUT44_10955 [Streptomyces carminius]|uniref:Uncharacterized protein n=1 Tax=Streptomyces carminius TaxID=2665496 RepID=A0A2M8M0B4_9ACTN|nr:hypothetical protein [Streptomyces carminius]PJE97653.1 hypothetical protein CUT44_10955 [Streptomyces carminius]
MTRHSRQDDEPREGVVLPSNGGEPWFPGRDEPQEGRQPGPSAGQPWDRPWGPQAQTGQPPQPGFQQQPPPPPEVPPAVGAVPGPADETQVLPPFPAGDPVAGPARPAHPAGGSGGADDTRRIRAVGRDAERDVESTTVLRRLRAPGGAPAGAAPQRPAGAPRVPGDRPTPADFDGLFRSGPQPGDRSADATQVLPPVSPAAAPPYGGAGGRSGGYGGGHDPLGNAVPGGGRRGLPRAALVGLVVAGLVAAGLAAGAALGGGDDDPAEARPQTKASAPAKGAESAPASPTADPAKAQAEALDELLADSGASRSAVIRSVENIRKCEKLKQAAADLRDAARQRNGLVTRLDELEIDGLPDHRALADALTEAWRASAEADDHYAAWADQVAGKKGCRKGKARGTGRTAQGNRASGEATAAKKEAAGLWNPTARKYGLPERQFSEL